MTLCEDMRCVPSGRPPEFPTFPSIYSIFEHTEIFQIPLGISKTASLPTLLQSIQIIHICAFFSDINNHFVSLVACHPILDLDIPYWLNRTRNKRSRISLSLQVYQGKHASCYLSLSYPFPVPYSFCLQIRFQ